MDTDGLARSWPWNSSCRMTSIEKLDCIFVSLRVVYNTSQRRSWGHHNVTNNTNVLLIRTPFMNDLLFIILIHSHAVCRLSIKVLCIINHWYLPTRSIGGVYNPSDPNRTIGNCLFGISGTLLKDIPTTLRCLMSNRMLRYFEVRTRWAL